MLNKIVEEYLNQIDLQKYSIVILNPLDEVSIMSNLSRGWEQDFLERKMHLRSHLVLNIKDRITPLKWSSLKTKNTDLSYFSSKYNIYNGVSFAIRLNYDFIIFTMYFNHNDDAFIELYSQNKHQIFFDIMSLFENHYVKKNKYSLSRREKEVFHLVKLGKTYAESALILNISERTVRFHVNNILTKLDVTSVRYAIYKATSERLI